MNQRLHDAVTSDWWRFIQPFLLALMTVFMGIGAKAGWATYDTIAEIRESQIQSAEADKYFEKAQDALIAAQKAQAATNESMRHDIDKNSYDIKVLKDWWRDDAKQTRPRK